VFQDGRDLRTFAAMQLLSGSASVFLRKVWWMGYEKSTAFFDRILWLLHIPAGVVPSKPEQTKRIVFVGELLPPRTPRMAKWITRSGNYACMLVCSKRGYVEKFSDPVFEKTFLFRNQWHLRRIMRGIPDIWLIHSFAPKSYYPDIARQMKLAPFIHDMQDVYAIYYGLNPTQRWLQHELPPERKCLEQASGLVAHSLEANEVYRQYGITRKPPNLFFPLYADNDFFCPNTKNPAPDDIHLVYVGGVAGSHRNPKQYGNIQFQSLIRILTSQQLHFHIYPSPSNIRADYEEYEELAKTNTYFHFHEPVAQQELPKELSRYHYGIHTAFILDNEQSAEKYKYCTTLKLFNYIEAGLPVIFSSDLTYLSWLVTRYGLGITVGKSDLETLHNTLQTLNYRALAEQVLKSRNIVSLQNNINRLIGFYQKIRTNHE